MLGLLFAALPLASGACGDDSGDDAPSSTGDAGEANEGTGGSTAADDAQGRGGACDLSRGDRPEELLSGAIDSDVTLDSSNYYTLDGLVCVMDGATLTIPPCTRIEGGGSSLGTLIVTRGGRVDAKGSAEQPILFTGPNSALDGVNPEPGDWGGVVILGQAPNSIGGDVLIEGLADDPLNQHGSDNPDAGDCSG